MKAVLDIVVFLVISYLEVFDVNRPTDFVSVILCLLFQSSVLRRLIAVTDRVCDRGDGMVSPLYVAVNRHQSKSVEILLREGYSPDAQDCAHILGLRSPLSFALCHTSNKPYRFVRKQI